MERQFIIGSCVVLGVILTPTLLSGGMVFLLSGAVPGTDITVSPNVMLSISLLALVSTGVYLFQSSLLRTTQKLHGKTKALRQRLPVKRFS